MAQELFYTPANSLELIPGEIYTTANIPTGIDTVVLGMGVRLKDNTGEETPLRGVRMKIVDNLALATTPVQKVPYVWIEGTELKFNPAYTYEPLNWGIVSYGIRS